MSLSLRGMARAYAEANALLQFQGQEATHTWHIKRRLKNGKPVMMAVLRPD